MTDKQQAARLEFKEWCHRNRYYTLWQMILNPPRKKNHQHGKSVITERQRSYRDVYLKSDHRKQLREEKLIQCPVCVWCGNTKDLIAHHHRYRDDIYECTIDDLTTLCVECHFKNHSRDMVSAYNKFLKEFPQFAYDAPCVQTFYVQPEAKPTKEGLKAKRSREITDRKDNEYINYLTEKYGKEGVKAALQARVNEIHEERRARREKFQVPRKIMESHRANGVWFTSAKY